jgi:hypothetical protein
MAMMVHLFDERKRKAIARSGIIGQRAIVNAPGGYRELMCAVYAMPVLPNYFASHQWLRELKRLGARTISAAYFKARSDTLVWVGRYNKEHRYVPLGHAISLIMAEPDPRGWEIVFAASVPAKAIHSFRSVDQVIGWRHFPESHEQGPWKCLCDYCLSGQKGAIKAKRLRTSLIDKYGPDALNIEPESPLAVAAKRKKNKR